MPDANARHVDERTCASGCRGLRGGVLRRQMREHASRQKRLPEIAPGEIGHFLNYRQTTPPAGEVVKRNLAALMDADRTRAYV